ncbi:hypothetical protein QTP88_013834 [Uroleucon formosanum]
MLSQHVWPTIFIKGCGFHLGQAWWRHIQNLGLSKDYRDQTEIGLFLKNIFGLPLLNQEDVENCIIEDFISIKPKHEKLNEFMDYIIENYIDSGAKFPISIWAEMNSSSERTTNACESFHSKPIYAGVPQGSKLGPILFNFYITDIPQTMDTNIALFADDTTIYCNSSDTQKITTALQNHLNKISLWCLKWKIIINPSKSQVVFFSLCRTQTPQLVKFDNEPLDWKSSAEQSVLGRILKNKEDIECKALQNESQSRKRKRRGKDNTVERALKEWFVKVRNKDARVSGSLLRQKTEELAEKMGKVDFKATEGWFHRALPKHTYVLQNDKAKGTKSCKKRITILCCASMTGEKKKLLVVGKSKQPRCFKGVNALPVDYTANKNAWMTQEIFCQWLIKWDNELDKKIVLLVDNCIAHNANDLSKKINILEALHFFNKAWNNISDVTIRNCFCHGGFVKTKEEEEEDDHSKNLADKTYEDWMDIDRDLQTSEEYSEDQICQSIINEITNNNDEENDESDEEVDIVVKPPSNKEFLEALDVIRRAVHHRGNNFNIQ